MIFPAPEVEAEILVPYARIFEITPFA